MLKRSVVQFARMTALSGCLGVAVAAGACGLRTDPSAGPLQCVEATGDGETGDMPREGSCVAPIPFNATAVRLEGSLGGCSDIQGWCGGAGGEDVFEYNGGPTDATFTFDAAATDFTPTLRVVKVPAGGMLDACAETIPEGDQDACTEMEPGTDSQSVFFEAGFRHFVVVDSGFGSAGDYALDIAWGRDLVPQTCKETLLTGEPIVLDTGGEYTWEDRLPSGQGEVDGNCGGPGGEHLFDIRLRSSGLLTVIVEPLDGDLAPVVSLRNPLACPAASELTCGGSELGGVAVLEYFVEKAEDNWWLMLDSLTVEGGRYLMTATLQ